MSKLYQDGIPTAQRPEHHRALAQAIGITPPHRNATPREERCARVWAELRGRAYREETEYWRERAYCKKG